MAAVLNIDLIEQLLGGYALHWPVYGLVPVPLERIWTIPRTRQPDLHLLSGIMIVLSGMSFCRAGGLFR